MFLATTTTLGCTTTWGVTMKAVTARDSTIVGVGTNGNRGELAVALSLDGGATWDVGARPSPALTHIAWAGDRLVGSSVCLPPSAGGTPLEPDPTTCLFASDDLGRTWLDLQAGRLVDPTFADATYGWAHPPFPIGTTLFETSDGGTTWTAFTEPCPEATPEIYAAVVTAPGAGYVVCYGPAGSDSQPWALLELTLDDRVEVRLEGRTNYAEEDPGLLDAWVQAVTVRSDGSGLLMANGLYRTANHGVTWEEVAVNGIEDRFFTGGLMVSTDIAYLIGGNGNWTAIVLKEGDGFRTLIRWPVMGGPAEIPGR